MFKLFRKKQAKPAMAEINDEPRPSVPIERVNAPLDVFDEDNRKKCSCRLKSYSAYEIVLERLPGEMSLPIFGERESVYVRGYTKDLRSLDLQGVVAKSTRLELRISRVKHRDYDDLRTSFRQPVYAPAEIYKGRDINRNHPDPCQLVNISTGGACVSGDVRYNIEADVLLRVELYPGAGPLSFRGRVIRVQRKADGEYEYGIIFAQLTAQKKHDLERDMEELRDILKSKTYK